MKIKNKILGVLGALSIALSLVVTVSAESNYTNVNESFSVPNFANNADIDTELLRQLYDAVYLNNSSVASKGYTTVNSFIAVSTISTGTYRLQVCKLQPYFHINTGENIPFYSTTSVTFNTVSFVSNYSFSEDNLTTYDMSSTSYYNRLYFDDRTPKFGNFLAQAQGYMYGVKYVNFTPNNELVTIIHDYNFPYDPILSPILDYPYNLDIQSQSFAEWLITTEKYLDIFQSLQANHVSGFVEVFRQYGGSASFFKQYCKGFFDFNNIGQGFSDYNLVLRRTKALYQEYLRLKNDTVGNHLAPRVESTIVPETNDSNTVLVTNGVDDTTIIALLRDILRSLIALPNTLNDLTQLILNKLDSLDLTTNIVNDGGSGITDFSDLYLYDVDAFNDDLADFEADIEDVQSVPMGYISTINQNSFMPENMLEDKNSLTVNVPTITGFTVGGNGSTYSTQTGSYVLRSVDYPWLDTVVQKIKRFGSILLILGYLVHLRYRIPELIRGE